MNETIKEALAPELEPWAGQRDVGNVSGTPSIRKPDVLAKAAVDTEKRTVEAVISTGGVDRQGDTIDPNGWELERYLSNPVVLWAHDYRSLPIGKALKVKTKGRGNSKKLTATAQFEDFPFADAVFNLIASGTLNATSVGFIPLEWDFADEEEGRGYFALDITKAELLEYSIVPVPANAEALIGAKGLSSDHRKALYDWTTEALEEGHEVFGLDKDALDQIHKAWGEEVKHYPLGAEIPVTELGLQDGHLTTLRINQDTVSIQIAKEEVPEVRPTPDLALAADPTPTRAFQARLKRLRLNSLRRGDTPLQ